MSTLYSGFSLKSIQSNQILNTQINAAILLFKLISKIQHIDRLLGQFWWHASVFSFLFCFFSFLLEVISIYFLGTCSSITSKYLITNKIRIKSNVVNTKWIDHFYGNVKLSLGQTSTTKWRVICQLPMLHSRINIPVPCYMTQELTYYFLSHLECSGFFAVFVYPSTATNLHQIAFNCIPSLP